MDDTVHFKCSTFYIEVIKKNKSNINNDQERVMMIIAKKRRTRKGNDNYQER